VKATIEQVKSFHGRISNLFETSITDAMRDHLVVVEEME
jgi:hypothetical protein